ncbi:scaffolding protein [Providencia phage vB_PstP_PS3]|uniref:Scaffolding protein n=1 Tax=Providencia phage vB_PstP_PS3 TaxID=2848038 RepID=A0A411AWB2_9CAUD|nr:head scaffolding protein [Providencia phage vB_PstP_PS3]QAX92397.1 scaffolding protein [Providencia phage vB_PstP_PS3]
MTEQVQAPVQTEAAPVPEQTPTGVPQIPEAGKPPSYQGVPVEKHPQPAESPEPTEPATPTSDPAQAGELESTGNAVLDSGLKTLQGITGCTQADMERAVAAAIKTGDASLIDEAFIKEKFGEHAEFATSLAKAYIQDVQAQEQQLVQSVHNAAGGKEQWDYMNQVFQGSAPEYLKNIVQAAVQAGKLEDAAQVVIQYAQSAGVTPQNKGVVHGSGGTGLGALSQSEFQEAYAALRKEAGNQSLESPKFKPKLDALYARRQAGISMGR